MTIGLPQHLARQTLSGAIAGGSCAAAFVCLATAAFVGLILALATDASALIGLGVTVVMIGLLIVLVRTRTLSAAIAYFVIGTAGMFVFSVDVLAAPGGYTDTSNMLIALPAIALVLGGGTATGSGPGLAWATAGFIGSGAAMWAGAVVTGASFRANTPVIVAFGILVIVLTFDGLTRGRAHRSDDDLQRASRETRELDIRRDYELRATARLHDTALNHLLAIASAPLGPIGAAQRGVIERDIESLVERNWFRAGGSGDRRPLSSPHVFAGPIERSAERGVRVTLSGDDASIAALSLDATTALVDAVDQCLSNVARHAGVDSVEIAVGSTSGRVSVAVIDAGRGFDTADVAADRLGLRTSVIGRMEAAGGEVKVWSSEGEGATVILTLPVDGRGGHKR